MKEGHAKMETETGVKQPQDKTKCHGLLGDNQREKDTRKDSSLEPSQRAWPCQYLDFEHFASRTEIMNSCNFKSPVCEHLL